MRRGLGFKRAGQYRRKQWNEWITTRHKNTEWGSGFERRGLIQENTRHYSLDASQSGELTLGLHILLQSQEQREANRHATVNTYSLPRAFLENGAI